MFSTEYRYFPISNFCTSAIFEFRKILKASIILRYVESSTILHTGTVSECNGSYKVKKIVFEGHHKYKKWGITFSSLNEAIAPKSWLIFATKPIHPTLVYNVLYICIYLFVSERNFVSVKTKNSPSRRPFLADLSSRIQKLLPMPKSINQTLIIFGIEIINYDLDPKEHYANSNLDPIVTLKIIFCCC